MPSTRRARSSNEDTPAINLMAMSPARYNELRAIFIAACDLDRKSQAQYLEQATAGDSQLRAQIQKLLEFDRIPHEMFTSVS